MHINGIETGSTLTPSPLLNNAPVEDFILQARNTIFAEELWQEMQREARTLLAFGVSSSVSAINIILTPTKTAVVDLIPLSFNSPSSSTSDDYLAQFIYNALHLSLIWAHLQARRRRAQQQPSKNQNIVPEPYSLIRPMLTRLAHENIINSLTDFLYPLIMVLRKASISASYTIKRTSLQLSPSLAKSEQVLTSLTAHLESVAVINLLPGTQLTLTTRTSTNRDMIPVFQIQLNNQSFMNTICPPPTIFHKFDDVREWVFWCTSCALTAYIFESFSKTRECGWYLSSVPNVLRRVFSGSGSYSSFISTTVEYTKDISTQKNIVKLRVSWEKAIGLPGENENSHDTVANMTDGFDEKKNCELIDVFEWDAQYAIENKRFDSSSQNWEIEDDIPNKALLEIVGFIFQLEGKTEHDC